VKWLNHMKRSSLILTVIIGVLALAFSSCFAQEGFSKLGRHGNAFSSNLTPPSEKSLTFFELPLGNYQFETSVQLNQIDQSKISPTDMEGAIKKDFFSLQFSIKW